MSKPNLVIASTLRTTDEWQNSVLIRHDVVDELTKRKQQGARTSSLPTPPAGAVVAQGEPAAGRESSAQPDRTLLPGRFGRLGPGNNDVDESLDAVQSELISRLNQVSSGFLDNRVQRRLVMSAVLPLMNPADTCLRRRLPVTASHCVEADMHEAREQGPSPSHADCGQRRPRVAP